MGMTDLQFKSYLRLLIRSLERVISKETKEEMAAEIETLIDDLQTDIKG